MSPLGPIRVLELAGTPFDMGFAHGVMYKDAIRYFAEERVRLCGDPLWAGQALSRSDVLALARACVREHERYTPQLIDELRGMAAATDLSLEELVIVNGFTDIVDTLYALGGAALDRAAPLGADNCTAFLVPDARAAGQGFLGQTWDMHDTATPHVILLRGRPDDAPAFLCLSTVGCVGMIGLNEAGLAVGINNLVGADGQLGVTWTFVVRQLLTRQTADEALALLKRVPLAGAHNYLIMDRSGKGYNVEAMSTVQHVTPLEDTPLVHTNHCTVPATKAAERTRDPASQASSEARARRAEALLSATSLTAHDLQALTRDDTICLRSAPPKFLETCGAAIMRPATGELWMAWGRPSENPYEHFRC